MSQSNEIAAAAAAQPIRPNKFYGSNSRQPRVIYPARTRTTILIDPPEYSPADSPPSKSKGAKWTLEGLGCKRLRLHGKVEGNLNRLRAALEEEEEEEFTIPEAKENVPPSKNPSSHVYKRSRSTRRDLKSSSSTSAQVTARVGSKRSRYAALIDEEEDDA